MREVEMDNKNFMNRKFYQKLFVGGRKSLNDHKSIFDLKIMKKFWG